METHQQWIWQDPNWPNFTWRAEALSDALAQARLAQGKLLGMAQLLDEDLTLEAVSTILIQDSVTTSEIEGERLNLEAVRSSVSSRLGLSTVGLPKSSRVIDGLVELLLDATQSYDTSLTVERLCQWQASLFPTGYSGLRQIRVGQLRGAEPMQVISGRMGREKVHFEAPAEANLLFEMNQFLTWFNQPSFATDGLIRAGIAHLWFITIHPFEDGNVRIARAITDMALAQDEQQSMRLFSLSAQILKTREDYYLILEQSQRGSVDITEWLLWFLKQIELAARQAELTVAFTLNKAKFWLRHQSTSLNERQRKVLNRLLDSQTGFEGDMNTRKYMSLTKTSRATAYRELTDLVEKNCLKPTDKAGRSSGYELIFLIAKS